MLITTVCAVLAGYALVHLRPRGGGFIVAVLLVSLYFPIRVVSIISVYEIQNFLGLINSTSGLILPYVTLNLAISVLIMRSVFQLVPHEMIEAAKIDGAGPWRTLWLVGLPMVRNGLVVVFIVNFVTAWGEFLLCTTLTNDQDGAHHAGRPRRARRAASANGPGRRSPPSTSSSSRPASSPSPSPKALLQGPGGRRGEGLIIRESGFTEQTLVSLVAPSSRRLLTIARCG